MIYGANALHALLFRTGNKLADPYMHLDGSRQVKLHVTMLRATRCSPSDTVFPRKRSKPLPREDCLHRLCATVRTCSRV